MGSRRSCPTFPRRRPLFRYLRLRQGMFRVAKMNASVTSGTMLARRPPNNMASMGTPFGSSHSGAITGHCPAGVVKRAFGCAAFRPDSGDQGRRNQSMRWAGFFSHPFPPDVSVFRHGAVGKNGILLSQSALRLRSISCCVPGATPKNPYSGLMA